MILVLFTKANSIKSILGDHLLASHVHTDKFGDCLLASHVYTEQKCTRRKQT